MYSPARCACKFCRANLQMVHAHAAGEYLVSVRCKVASASDPESTMLASAAAARPIPAAIWLPPVGQISLVWFSFHPLLPLFLLQWLQVLPECQQLLLQHLQPLHLHARAASSRLYDSTAQSMETSLSRGLGEPSVRPRMSVTCSLQHCHPCQHAGECLEDWWTGTVGAGVALCLPPERHPVDQPMLQPAACSKEVSHSQHARLPGRSASQASTSAFCRVFVSSLQQAESIGSNT